MLQHTFIHLSGVGGKTEQRLWSAGLTRWDLLLDGPPASFPPSLPERAKGEGEPAAPLDAVPAPDARPSPGPPKAGYPLPARERGKNDCPRVLGLSPRRRDALRSAVAESAEHLAAGDAGFFGQRLPAGQLWRMFADFHEQAAYLDIETSGADIYSPITVTAACLHQGGRTHFFVRNENLHELPLHLAGVKLLVTYNGRSFDWPVLRSQFIRLPEPEAHLDLRTPFARLGFRGGLKAIEPAAGCPRPAELEGLAGWSAVWLWHRHERGDSRALPALLRYNAEDVLNLKFLAEWVYNRLAGRLPVSARLFACPARASCPNLPAADASIMEECRAAMRGG